MAVLVDATLVRGVLVPAFMRLAGDANWWAPRPLRRIYDRFGISEAKEEEEETSVPRTMLRGIVADRDLGRLAAGARDIQYRRDVLRSFDRAASMDDALAVLRHEGVQPGDIEDWRRELAEEARS
jgi:hypothetical protein